MPRTRGVRAALALGLVALALSACTKHREGPPPLSSAEVVTSPTATATERPMPQVPAAARENTPAGAEALARYVVSVYGYVYQTGDSWPLDAVAGPNCGFCKNVHRNVAEMRSKGNHRIGGDVTIRFVSRAPGVPAGKAAFTISVDQAAAREVDAQGKTVATFKPLSEEPLLVAVKWGSLSWQLFDVGSDKAPK